MAQIDLKNVSILLRDGSVSPNILEIKLGEGNLTWSEKRNVQYTLNKGRISGDTVRLGDEVPVDLSIDGIIEFLRSTGSEPITPDEFIKKLGPAASFLTTDPDPCAPYCVDIVLKNAPVCASITLSEQYEFFYFRYESIDYDVKAATFALKGKCNVLMPTITRTAFS